MRRKFIKRSSINAASRIKGGVTVKDIVDALKSENKDAVVKSIGTMSGSPDYVFIFHLDDGSEIRV